MELKPAQLLRINKLGSADDDDEKLLSGPYSITPLRPFTRNGVFCVMVDFLFVLVNKFVDVTWVTFFLLEESVT